MKAVFASLFIAMLALAGIPAHASTSTDDGATVATSEDSRPETATPTRIPSDPPSDEEKKPEEEKKAD